jgi:hypothetical protein
MIARKRLGVSLVAKGNYLTLAEKSGWQKTGRYDEVERLCKVFQRNFPAQVKSTSFGATAEGRELLAVVASTDGVFAPKAARAKKRPVIFFQGCIHAGESDGKDAGFWLLRELLASNPAASVLAKVTLVFVPVFNVDGHERMSKHNRPNQNGPEEMGFRTTGQNLNLNRDYVKAESPEMAAMLRYLNQWDPILYADFHVTDGAHFAHDIAFVTHPTLKGPKALSASARELTQYIVDKLAKNGHLPLDFYPTFIKEDDPTSGVNVDISLPRFSHAYWGDRNRIGVLIETHSWKDYATRVKGTYLSMMAMLEKVAANGKDWLKHAQQADAQDKKIAGKQRVLAYENTKKSRPFDFQGAAYKKVESEISGKDKIVYDPSKPEVWKVPLFEEVVPSVVVKAPKKGYWAPPAHAAMVGEKLELHDIDFALEKKAKVATVEVFRPSQFGFSKETFEGRTSLTVKGAWSKEKREIPAGSLFVPIAQVRSGLLMHLLEPLGPDSLLQWGFFNAHFERKEYIEDYVIEEAALDMLASNEALREEFVTRLKEDESFRADPKQRLDFFYRRHPSWDERYAMYPVFRQ